MDTQLNPDFFIENEQKKREEYLSSIRNHAELLKKNPENTEYLFIIFKYTGYLAMAEIRTEDEQNFWSNIRELIENEQDEIFNDKFIDFDHLF